MRWKYSCVHNQISSVKKPSVRWVFGKQLSSDKNHSQMHSFLYTVAVILQSTTLDTRLRSLCFKAWTIQLSAHEQVNEKNIYKFTQSLEQILPFFLRGTHLLIAYLFCFK